MRPTFASTTLEQRHKAAMQLVKARALTTSERLSLLAAVVWPQHQDQQQAA